MKKILLVEDNPEIAELLRDGLYAEGFEVAICPDAYQGVEFTHRIRPDLIILDLMLPAGGGFAVLEKIKLSVKTRHIPVVILTASKDTEHRKKAIEMGAKAYLEKPYETKDLADMIRSILGIQ